MNIRGLFKQLSIDFIEGGHHHARSGWLQVRTCPFCRSGNYHLGYNTRAGYFNCWKCGSHSSFETLKALGASGKDAATISRERTNEAVGKRERKGLSEPSGRGPLMDAHCDYLRSRGFEPGELERIWHLEAIGIAARLAWRIYIPVELHSRRVSWTTRSISSRPEIKRYMSASVDEEAINHKDLLYGGDYCRHSCVIVEGPADVWAIGPGAVGLFGQDFSSAQVRRLVEIPNRFICFDNQVSAQARADELCSALSVFDGTTTNLTIDAKDPGEASEKELKLIRKVANLE